MVRRKSLSSTQTGALDASSINVTTLASSTAAKIYPRGASAASANASDSTGNQNQKRRGKRVCRVTVDVTACRYAVIKKCLRERGFRLVKAKEGEAKPRWDIWWSDRGDLLRELPRLSAFQKINHFPAMEEICRKDFLANNLNAIYKVLSDEFDFFPRSFLLPAESVELQKCMEKAPKSATFIAKPRTLCQGKGISLVQIFAKMPKGEPCVVQRYIDNPLLIDGFKFDLRIYVLVFSVHPLKIFIFKNGLARFCTSAFQRPTKKNLSQKRMHLTNYAVNKHSKLFQQASTSDENKGSKRSLAAIMKYLDDTGRYSSHQVWMQICDIVVKTLLCIQPKLSSSYKSFFGESDVTWGPKCFEVLGFDIMLDASGKAWLFEVNHAPSFAGDSPLDREIKSALISSTLALVGVTNEKKRAFLKGNRLEWAKRLWKTQPAISTKKTASALKAVGDGSSGGGATQSQRVEARSKDSKAPLELLRHSQHPEEQDTVDVSSTVGDWGQQLDDSGDDDNYAASDPEGDSDNHDNTDEESGSNQSQEQPVKLQPSGTTLGATAEPLPVKLPGIRNIFRKKNRVSPGNPEADAESTQGPSIVTSTDMLTASTVPIASSVTIRLPPSADASVTTTEFTNEFVQIYPVLDAPGGVVDHQSSQQLLYERIRAAAEVNKSKLWS